MKILNTAMWSSLEKEHRKSNLKGLYCLRKSGEGWAFNRVEAGPILGFISKDMDHLFIPCYRAEPHILLFRRPLGTDPRTGIVNQELVDAHYDKVEE
jgi:hypothetical protein